MKLGHISDLHIDYNEREKVVEAFISVVKDRGYEAVTIAGDISSSSDETFQFVTAAEQTLGIPIHFIMGNHDYWCLPGAAKHTIQEIRANDMVRKSPLVIGNCGFIMDTGWYDFTWHRFGSLGQVMRGKTIGSGTWSDFRFIKTEESDDRTIHQWLSRQCLDNMQNQNDWLNNNGITKKIVMVHMVPHYRFLRQEYEYQVTNVYFGSERLSDFIYDVKPEYCFYGHTHFPQDRFEDTKYICRPLGYHFEWGNKDAVERFEQLFFEYTL